MNCRAEKFVNCGAKRCKGAYGNFSSSQNNLDDYLQLNVPKKNRSPNASTNDLDDYTNQKYQTSTFKTTRRTSQNGTEDQQQNFVAQNRGTDQIKNVFMVNQNLKMTESAILSTLRSVRAPIVNYQETRGVSRNEQISFINLITSLCTHAYTAAITILVMLWNLAPLLDGFVYFARFTVDKLIDIFETDDPKEKIIKTAVFAGEIIIILFLIFLIIGLIFMPVYVLTARIISKIWGMIGW
ncbi:uncharacterized protein LOC130902682 [Diorhabda carinulata]|uniref:uncharacterized protein LOC130902682 n=1 Tax=Diorhabda carinulata TaxID=1163345 RepID=UPI0025A116BA|nr:uncharacterized protein LOC130902682 [Diorhabda carinulata]